MREQSVMVAYIVNKHDFFGFPILPPDLEKLPETIAVCDRCFNADLINSSHTILRALAHSREVLSTEELPTQERPPRCHVCGRFIVYPAALEKASEKRQQACDKGQQIA
jgi:hypothetical protein